MGAQVAELLLVHRQAPPQVVRLRAVRLKLALRAAAARPRGRAPVHIRRSAYAPPVRGAAPGGRRPGRRRATGCGGAEMEDRSPLRIIRAPQTRLHGPTGPFSGVAGPRRGRRLAAFAVLLRRVRRACGQPGHGGDRRPPRPGAPGVGRGLERAGRLGDEPGDGRVVFTRNPGTPLRPASNEKLTVSVAALDRLGPGYRIPTRVYGEGHQDGRVWRGRLVLKGFGDPTLQRLDLVAMANALREGGIRSVTGGIRGDESYFDTRRTAPGWKPSYYKLECPPLTALISDRGEGGRPDGRRARVGSRARLPAGADRRRRPRRRPCRIGAVEERGVAPRDDALAARQSDHPQDERPERQLLRRDARQAARQGAARCRDDGRGHAGRPPGAEEPKHPDGGLAARRTAPASRRSTA